MNVNSFNTGKYVKLDTWSDAQKQTQSNPIQSQNKPNSQNDKNERKLLFNRQLRRNWPGWLAQNKPNQTQFKSKRGLPLPYLLGGRRTLRASFSESSNWGPISPPSNSANSIFDEKPGSDSPVLVSFNELVLHNYTRCCRYRQNQRQKPFVIVYKPFYLFGCLRIKVQKRQHPRYNQDTSAKR